MSNKQNDIFYENLKEVKEEKKMKTPKQQAYHQKRCTYCEGTGVDKFNQTKPCPICSSEPVLLKKKDLIECAICGREIVATRPCPYCNDLLQEIDDDKIRHDEAQEAIEE